MEMGLNKRVSEASKIVKAPYPQTREAWDRMIRSAQEDYLRRKATGRFCDDCNSELVVKFSRKNDQYFLGCPRWPACEGRSQPIYLEDMVGKEAASAYFDWERGEKARAKRLKQEQTKSGKRGLKLNLRPSLDDAVFESVVEGCIKLDLFRSRNAFSRMYQNLWGGEDDGAFAANC
jgi:hypothetical protein